MVGQCQRMPNKCREKYKSRLMLACFDVHVTWQWCSLFPIAKHCGAFSQTGKALISSAFLRQCNQIPRKLYKACKSNHKHSKHGKSSHQCGKPCKHGKHDKHGKHGKHAHILHWYSLSLEAHHSLSVTYKKPLSLYIYTIWRDINEHEQVYDKKWVLEMLFVLVHSLVHLRYIKFPNSKEASPRHQIKKICKHCFKTISGNSETYPPT